jgi:hypothetical protein
MPLVNKNLKPRTGQVLETLDLATHADFSAAPAATIFTAARASFLTRSDNEAK